MVTATLPRASHQRRQLCCTDGEISLHAPGPHGSGQHASVGPLKAPPAPRAAAVRPRPLGDARLRAASMEHARACSPARPDFGGAAGITAELRKGRLGKSVPLGPFVATDGEYLCRLRIVDGY